MFSMDSRLPFAWISSSESGLFNGLRTLSGEIIFARSVPQNQASTILLNSADGNSRPKVFIRAIVADIPISSKKMSVFLLQPARACPSLGRIVPDMPDAKLLQRQAHLRD
jgi:hypothetical protein